MKYTPILLILLAALALTACSETANNKNTSPQSAANSTGVKSTPTATQANMPQIPAEIVESAPATQPAAIIEAPLAETAAADTPASTAVVATPVYAFPASTPRNLQQRFKEHDLDKDGQLNIKEFTSYLTVWMSTNMPQKDPVTWAPPPFSRKDKNNDDLLSPMEAFNR